MVQARMDRRGIGQILRSREMGAALTRVAGPLTQRIRAATPVSKRPGGGGTAASTTASHPELSALRDRMRVRISQRSYTGRNRPRGGAAAPLEWGNDVTRQRSQFARGVSGGPAR